MLRKWEIKEPKFHPVFLLLHEVLIAVVFLYTLSLQCLNLPNLASRSEATTVLGFSEIVQVSYGSLLVQ